MTAEEEEEFLRPFVKKAPQGGIVEIREIKEAFEARTGATIPKSTISLTESARVKENSSGKETSQKRSHPAGGVKKLIGEAFD